MLTYLDPGARARWESALLLPPAEFEVAGALAQATGSWYLSETLRAQQLFGYLNGLGPPDSDGQDDGDQVQQALESVDGLNDPIQADLVRLAACWALAPRDAERADAAGAAQRPQPQPQGAGVGHQVGGESEVEAVAQVGPARAEVLRRRPLAGR